MPAALFVNDYSFHGQFTSPDEVIAAIRRLRALQVTCSEYSIECFCSRVLLGNRDAIAGISLNRIVREYPNADARRLVLAWLDKHGPYWETTRIHDAGDWYYAVQRDDDETLVTDSAVAECAARVLMEKQNAGLLSATPSDFTFTPICAGVRDDGGITSPCELPNHWDEPALRQFLGASISVADWRELRDHVTQRFAELVFADDAFVPLMRSPFSVGLRNRIIEVLAVLDRISVGTDALTGSLSDEAAGLREKFFVGEKALFTDSSDSEKRTFKAGLTFPCPVLNESKMFPWHGKIKIGAQYRIHFGWPKPNPTQGLPVVYVGPKITKR